MRRFLMALSLVVCSCEQAAELPEVVDYTKTANVSISLTDNLLDSSSDLIAVQLYSVNDGVVNVYGYGLFDSYDFPTLELLTYQSYYLIISVVADGQNIIAYNETESGREYYKPFSQYGALPILADNEFHLSLSTYFGYLNNGVARVVEDGMYVEYAHPSLERYIGYSEIFSVEENTNVAVELKVVYGSVRLEADGLDEGTLTFKFEGAPDLVLTPDNRTLSAPLSLTGTGAGSSDWVADGYSEELSFSVVYTTSRGVETVFYDDGVIELVRGKTQPISVQSSLGVDFTISVESADWEELPEIIIGDI